MRPEKKQLVEDLKKILDDSPNLFLVSYSGLTVAEFGELREKLLGAGSECHVVPNRLFMKASEESGFAALTATRLTEDNALVTGGTDPVAVAKVLKDFGKSHEEMGVKIGVIGGKLCDAAGAAQLADLPSREVLLAQLLGLLQAPSSQLVRVLHAKLASIVYVLNAYLTEKEKAA